MSEESDFSLSKLSIHSNGSQSDDWDRSIILNDSEPSSPRPSSKPLATTTPRNSVAFPADSGATPRTSKPDEKGKRSLSELLRLHAEKGTSCNFSPEELARVEDVLGQWINNGSSPYEGEDDFFARGSQDDLSVPSKRSPAPTNEGRPRGQSESANSRPPSAAGTVTS